MHHVAHADLALAGVSKRTETVPFCRVSELRVRHTGGNDVGQKA